MKEEHYKIITPEDDLEIMLQELKTGRAKGTTTYIKEYDNCWTWKEKTVNILTGYSNEGKGLWIKQMALIKALEEKKKFIIYAPEDYPSKDYFDDMIHTLTGRTTDTTYPTVISEELYLKAYNLIKDLFFFIYIKPPHNNLSNLIEVCSEITNDNDIFGLIVDPHSQVERDKNAPDRDDLYGSYFMSILKDFSMTHNVITFLIMHQQTPKKNEVTQCYPEPDGYAVKQGGNYMNSSDSIHITWRPDYGKNKESTRTIVGTKKVKSQKLVGIPQTMEFDFDRKSNRYIHMGTRKPVYNWDKWLK